MLKNTIFFLCAFLLSNNYVLGQQNNPPTLYRVVNRTPQPGFGGFISIIDPLTMNETKRLDIGTDGDITISVTPDKKRAFVMPLFPFKGLLITDLIQETTTKLFQSSRIYKLKQAPDGSFWVLLGEENQINIVNAQSSSLVASINNINKPRDIIFNSDGSKAYISLENNDIIIFDTKKRAPLTSITNLPSGVPNIPRGIELAISPDDKTLVLASKNLVMLFDTNSLKMIDSFSFENKSMANLVSVLFSIDGKTIYTAETIGLNIYKYELESKKLTKIFTSKRFTIQDIKLSSDGKLLYISDFSGKSVLDTQTDSTIFSITDFINFADPVSLGIALVGDFTIGQPPSLQTTSPIASQQVMPNQAFNIRWQTTVMPQSYSIASHRIELSTDGGATFNVIPGAEQLKAEDQSFIWQVPDIEVAKAQIKVSTVDLGARRASSTTGNFTISRNGGGGSGDTQAPTVNFLSPKGGERFNSGDSLQISWMSSDNVGVSSQDLSLSTDGGATFPITIASGLSGAAQNFTYQIPTSLQSDQTRLRLIVRDAAGNSAQAITVNNFSIVLGADTIPPTVVISQPTQSQSIVAGQPIQVKWQSTDNRAVVSQALLLSLDGGKTFSQISSFGATDNSFVLSNLDKLNFTTPQAIVKITAIDSTGNKGEANSTFTISPAITNAIYQAESKTLSISGIGFMSNVNNTVRLFVNGKEVSLTPKSVSNSTFTIKGNKKKLTLTKGANTAQLVVDGVTSNSFSFMF